MPLQLSMEAKERFRREAHEVYKKIQTTDIERLKNPNLTRPQRAAIEKRLRIRPREIEQRLIMLARIRGEQLAKLLQENLNDLFPDFLDFPEREYTDEQQIYVAQRREEFEHDGRVDFQNPVSKFQFYEIVDEEIHIIRLRRKIRCQESENGSGWEKALTSADKRLLDLYAALNLLERQKGKPQEEDEGQDKVEQELEAIKRKIRDKEAPSN